MVVNITLFYQKWLLVAKFNKTPKRKDILLKYGVKTDVCLTARESLQTLATFLLQEICFIASTRTHKCSQCFSDAILLQIFFFFQLHSFAAARKKLTTFLAELHIPKSTLQPRSRRARIAKLTAENKTQSTPRNILYPGGAVRYYFCCNLPSFSKTRFCFFFLKWLISPKSLANVCREKNTRSYVPTETSSTSFNRFPEPNFLSLFKWQFTIYGEIGRNWTEVRLAFPDKISSILDSAHWSTVGRKDKWSGTGNWRVENHTVHSKDHA